MAKIFTHDCTVCKTETEQDVQLSTNHLNIKCKCCGHKESIPLAEENKTNERKREQSAKNKNG